MMLLVLGLVFLILKLAGVAPVALWSWWWVLSPFALTALWWAYSDLSGRTRRKAMLAEDARRAQRVEESRKRLHGIKGKGR